MNLATDSQASLAHDEIVRYSRHLILPEVGPGGQARLKAAKVLLIGAGGLGSPAALYLAAAGIGTIGLVDFDAVDLSNLQRQVIHGTGMVGRSKLDSAAARLRDLNPHTHVETFPVRLTSHNAREILHGFDVVVDGSDNFPTRYLVNDASVLLGMPNVYGAVFRFEGQVSVFHGSRGPCYRCLYPDPPPPGLVPTCAEGGVLGVLPGIIGCVQALEALKQVLGAGDSLVGRLLLVDGLALKFRELQLRKDPSCPVCGEHPTLTHLVDYDAFCGLPSMSTSGAAEIMPRDLAEQLQAGASVQLLDVREPFELEICSIPGSLHIPLRLLPARLRELDPHREVVTICHHGNRSLHARDILRGAGFAQVRSLRGGVAAWADEVDPEMARY